MARFFLPLIPDGEFDAATVSATTQALSVATFCTNLTGTDSAACVATLPAGTKIGQLKKIVTRAKTNATTIKVTLTSHFATASDVLTLTEDGDYALCQWQDGNTDASNVGGAGWKVLEVGNIDAGAGQLG
tara:strand:- start:89 stop:478 length:390 start_codon:yes stop_codon:yes gene_type:complete